MTKARVSVFLTTILLCFCGVALGSTTGAAGKEIYRIRLRNVNSGLIQVSLDAGQAYATVGRVTHPANARIVGFAAASYTPEGTVAATAVHGIRIKTGQFAQGEVGKAQMPLMFSITPVEFASIPQGYGGHIPRSSGILTDIYSGHSIFRNFSPYVGSQVFAEKNRSLSALPEDYTPIEGDTYVIVVKRSDKMPSEIDFENREGGNVTVMHADGSSEVIAQVDRPVSGVGRYDGTSLTGVGAVNTNHGGVITISTAPVCLPGTHEGGPAETRGGFMIQPYYHVTQQGESKTQVMVIGPKDKSKPSLEGTPPLFDGCISLSSFPDKPECGYRAQVKIDDGEWEEMPKIVGKVDDAFTHSYLTKYFQEKGQIRTIAQGVTGIRLLLPEFDAGAMVDDLKKEALDYYLRSLKTGLKPVGGRVKLTTSSKYRDVEIVTFYVDGRRIYSTSQYPCSYNWNSASVPNGLHLLETEILSNSGMAVEKKQMLFRN